jgi:hypothetical protein
MSCKNPKECDEGCPGWAWFNGCEIQRCDTCERFVDDESAAKHVEGCAECALALGVTVAHGEAGYTHCACRDCFDETVSSDETKPELCSLCEEAGCDADGESECEREPELEESEETWVVGYFRLKNWPTSPISRVLK